MQFEIWYLIPLAAIVLNVVVSIVIAKRDDLELFQKIAQTVLVWLIPFFSGIGLWLFHKSNDVVHSKPNQAGNYAKDDHAYVNNNHQGDV